MTDSFKDEAQMCFVIHHHVFAVHCQHSTQQPSILVKSNRKSEKDNKTGFLPTHQTDQIHSSENLLCTSAGKTSKHCINPGHMWRVGFVQVHIYSTGEEGEE